jgi:drug/metabolite transporter (DMT)-like permease
MWQGATLALAAACAHTGIDALRKHGAQRIPADQLVALVGVLDSLLSVSFVAGFGAEHMVHIQHLPRFIMAVLASSSILLFSKVLYQRALHMAPLSLTIPYLSFSPAILLLTAYLILGEVPSASGLLGVAIVTAAGYLLGRHGPAAKDKDKDKEEDPREDDASQQLQVIEIKLYSGGGGGGGGGSGAGGAWGEAGAGNSLTIKAPRLRMLAARALRPLQLLHNEPGCVAMLAVAFLSSITASLDKLGVVSAASISVYFATQRLLMGLACLAYLLLRARGAFAHFASSAPLLLAISSLELAAVVLFLKALDYLFVSYVVAIKRSNILLSVLVGGLVFKESIASRLPYVLAMLAGMLLIVAEPGHHRLHSSVNTHH